MVQSWFDPTSVQQVDTLIRYLLDELTRYEKNHRDALCPIPREADKSFNGDHVLTAPVTAAAGRFRHAVGVKMR